MTQFEEPSSEAVRELLRAMTGRRVLVVGDGMLDGYIYGTATRLSPEAPVQVVRVEREEYLLGGAANVAKCLVALGARVSLCCIVGNDALGDQFITEARSLTIDTRLVFRTAARRTTVKTRIVSGRQQIVRIDYESNAPYPSELLDEVAQAVRAAARESDAILLSDYDKGVLAAPVTSAAIQGAGERPVVVDPKGQNWKQRYAGATVIKPNWLEAQTMLAPRDSSVLTLVPSVSGTEVQELATHLRRALNVKNVLLTLGEYGCALATEDDACQPFKARAADVKDVAGAGDVVAAVMTLALAGGAPMPLAAWLGNLAAGIKVSKFGTLTVSDYEILESLGESHPSSQRKLLTPIQAAELAASLRANGKRVVFTNGCFDILHLGHVTYLERARQLGDALIVAINTDASVRRLKGPDRPVNPEGDRSRVISSLACVDGVVLFGEDTPLEIIKAIKPAVLCKGADYKTKQEVVGWDVVEANGGRVALIELVEGRSTSGVIEKLGGR